MFKIKSKTKRIRGDIEILTYKKGKLVNREIRKNSILNEDHWKDWGKLDRGMGATGRVFSNFDYTFGDRVFTRYTTTKGDEKVIYKNRFNNMKRDR